MGAAAVPLALAGASLFSANKAASAQKNASRGANSLAKAQLGLFNQASPHYGSILQYLQGSAGLGSAAGEPSPAANGGLPPGQGSLPPGALGIYGTNPADQYRLRQAEEELSRARMQREQALRFRLGRQGAGEATTASALGTVERDYQSELGQFQRGLAINAGQEQERRVQALLAALGVGFGQGGAAGQAYGQLGATAAGQLGQSGGMLGQALSDLMLARLMRRQQGTPPIVASPEYQGQRFSPYLR